MEDQKVTKSLYDSSRGEIFSKHFIAGFSHGLGGFVVTLISWGVIYLIVVKLLLPQLDDTIRQFNDTLKLIAPFTSSSSQTKPGTIQVPENLIKELQRGN